MEINSDNERFQLKFGHCTVTWKVENYCLVTCREGLMAESPDFYVRGPRQTRWSLSLNSASKVQDMRCIIVCLKRSDSDDGPDVVWVNWKMCLLNTEGQLYGMANCEHFFERNSAYSVDVESEDCIMSTFQPLCVDSLRVRCQMIVHPDNMSSQFGKAKDIGLCSLSQDLSVLYNRGKHHDVCLKVGRKQICAHKCIMCCRNKNLARAIEAATEDVVDVPTVSYEAMEKAVAYLYSGNLNLVLEKPSILLYECILFLDIDELKVYYAPDEIFLHTTIEVEELVFLWLITDFSTRNEDCISSPVLTTDASGMSWKVHLYPKGVGDDVHYIGVFAEMLGQAKPAEICLELAVLDTNRDFFHAKRIRAYIDSGKAIGCKDFVKREDLDFSSLLYGDVLRVLVKFRKSTGVHTNELPSRMMSSLEDKKEASYLSLSKDLTSLLKTRKFSDLVLLADGQTFCVHRAVVSARSRILACQVNNMQKDETVLTVLNVDPTTLGTVIAYIYSGVLKDCDAPALLKVCEAAEKLGMPTLKDICSEALQTRVEVHSVCDVLLFARSRNTEMKLSAMKFIRANTEAVYDHHSWKLLSVTEPDAYAEVIEFVNGNQGSIMNS